MDFNNDLSSNRKMEDPESRKVQDLQKKGKKKPKKFKSGFTISIETVDLLTKVVKLVAFIGAVLVVAYVVNLGIEIYTNN